METKMVYTLSDLVEQLKEKGFEPKYFDYLDGELCGLHLENDKGKHLILDTCYTEEYVEELSNLEEGEEYEVDYSKVDCIGASFLCVISYPYGPHCSDGEYSSFISLGNNNSGYCGMEYFWEAFEAFMDPVSWELKVAEKHLEHLKFIVNKLAPILKKYDFMPEYSSFFDSTEKTHIGSTPTFTYQYGYDKSEEIYFTTDPISLKLEGTIDPYSEDFEQGLIKYMYYDYEYKIPKSCFERFFTDDKTYTPTSHRDILALSCSIMGMKGEKYVHVYPPSSIDFNNIPESQKHLIEEYNALYKDYKKKHYE